MFSDGPVGAADANVDVEMESKDTRRTYESSEDVEILNPATKKKKKKSKKKSKKKNKKSSKKKKKTKKKTKNGKTRRGGH